MSAAKKKIRPSLQEELKNQRFNFKQILYENGAFQQFEKLSFGELSDLATKYELLAFRARYALWRLREFDHKAT
jgi:hypothetical protein